MKKYKLIKQYPFSGSDLHDIIETDKTELDLFPEFWQEVKEPLFITEDNVPIYEGEDYWIVPNDLNGFWKTDSKAYEKRKDSLFFSSRKSAEQWIEQNKPIFSKKQVLDALKGSYIAIHNRTSTSTDTGNYVLSEKLFKKKLGL